MSPGLPTSDRANVDRFAPPAAVAIAFLAACVLSWRRLGSLLIDGGRELDVPRRILEGNLLYADVRYYWGPLGPYVNALLYAAFGVRIDVLMYAGIASAALGCAGLYLLARHFLDRWPSAAVASAFVFVCAFPQLHPYAIFNFVLPFNFSATYGMVAAIWSVHFLVRYLSTGERAPLWASAFTLSLAALTKVEVLFAAAAAHAAVIAFARRPARVAHSLSLAAAAGAVLAIYAVLWIRVGPALWTDNLRALANEASAYYVAETMGVRDLAGSLAKAAWSALALAVVLGAGFAAVVIRARQRTSGAADGSALAGAVAVALFVSAAVPVHITFRALPLVMAVAVVVLAVACVRARVRADGRWLAHFAVWVFGLAALARVPLRAAPTGYGFFLLPPGLVCIGILAFEYAPRAVGGGTAARRVFALVGAALFAGCAFAALKVSWPYYTEHRVELVTRRGTLRVRPGAPELPLVSALAKLPPGSVVAAVPQGVGLAYASGASPVADGMTSYLPMELGDETERRIIDAWERRPPDAVVLWRLDQRDTFGHAGFGVDYARRAGAWLADRYVPASDPSAAFVLLVPIRRR